MSSLFRLDASIRQDGSFTRDIADRLVAAAARPDLSITIRDLGNAPLPSTAWAGAVFGPYTPADQRTPEQVEGLTLAATIADELLASDAYIFAVPLYNYGVSQHFKAWIDLLLTDARFAPGTESPIAGRPARLIVAKGGGYGPQAPRHGWDHATGWYMRMLVDVLKLEVELIECELTLADVTPAMESLRPQAAQNLAAAQARAEEHGRSLSARLTIAAAA
ncbi:FMN-dependent NADH-azoreductase [Devosia lucknowensis]|uniref:FMN-dependent NADH-azoreductase n=1 Tax=Devosia lucknowensis TaxID=1096929 RepID=A0A1Y6FLX8_9HYPH|nr:NAD(P)H-dependent oxidoreductase [Devosia lucknowensis]SMQ75727.1 FMN-dependent NADH-azoreductase [Devosia lucknowensis]